jgi:hypothetical protein
MPRRSTGMAFLVAQTGKSRYGQMEQTRHRMPPRAKCRLPFLRQPKQRTRIVSASRQDPHRRLGLISAAFNAPVNSTSKLAMVDIIARRRLAGKCLVQ